MQPRHPLVLKDQTVSKRRFNAAETGFAKSIDFANSVEAAF
jgi:hypothetical protein